jgi:hypothetical protein
MYPSTLFALGSLFLAAVPPASPPVRATLTVDARAGGIAVPETLHGLFFEDINFAADGGLYAELVRRGR